MKPIYLLLCLFCFSISIYGQRQPIENLPTVSPEDVGFNRDSIDALHSNIQNTQHKDFVGLVVIKDNKIAIERYYNSFWRNHIHDIRSAGKSITSLLLGVAMQEGLVQSLDQNVYSFFPKDKYPGIHEDYKKIKIKHLLDMSSGLDADSDDWRTPGQAGQWIAKDEWLQYILTIPLVFKPGEKWVYADINAALVGAIIEEKSGMSLRDFAKEKVFDPLKIKEFYWYTNAANQTVAAGTFYLSTLDFAKFGVLLANEGKWGDNQIIQADYVNKLLARRVFDMRDKFFLADSYGMFWYKAQGTFNGKDIDYLFAAGKGGNQLVVVPEENMVIALTSSAYGPWHGHSRAYSFLAKVLNAID